MSIEQKRIHMNYLRSQELTGSNLVKKTKCDPAAVALDRGELNFTMTGALEACVQFQTQTPLGNLLGSVMTENFAMPVQLLS